MYIRVMALESQREQHPFLIMDEEIEVYVIITGLGQFVDFLSISALMLLAGWQEGRPVSKQPTLLILKGFLPEQVEEEICRHKMATTGIFDNGDWIQIHSESRFGFSESCLNPVSLATWRRWWVLRKWFNKDIYGNKSCKQHLSSE